MKKRIVQVLSVLLFLVFAFGFAVRVYHRVSRVTSLPKNYTQNEVVTYKDVDFSILEIEKRAIKLEDFDYIYNENVVVSNISKEQAIQEKYEQNKNMDLITISFEIKNNSNKSFLWFDHNWELTGKKEGGFTRKSYAKHTVWDEESSPVGEYLEENKSGVYILSYIVDKEAKDFQLNYYKEVNDKSPAFKIDIE